MIFNDNDYIKVYDKLGHKYFNKGSDKQLIDWGNSIDDIKKIKINSVKCELEWYSRGIKTYKLLNSLQGGVNKI
jgi:hypothetical protein